MARPRFWLPAFAKSLLAEQNMTPHETYLWLSNLLRRVSDHGLIPLDAILLPDSDPAVASYLQAALEKDWSVPSFRRDSCGDPRNIRLPSQNFYVWASSHSHNPNEA